MPAYNFQKRFKPKILCGEKNHTIREDRKDGKIPKAGEIAYLYTGLRSKKSKKIGESPIIKVTRVVITKRRHDDEFDQIVYLDGVPLTETELHRLAMNDGFQDAGEFIGFFEKHYSFPFSGWMTHWKPLPEMSR